MMYSFQIWVFGMIEVETNTLIMYPVDRRSADTLIPLLQKRVEPGSVILSDGWAAYDKLNELGFKHFSVIHKHAFRKKYR